MDKNWVKVIFLGNTGVGKTSIIHSRCFDSFSSMIEPTINTSNYRTNVKIMDSEIELRLWDTAGQEQYSSLVPLYCRDVKVCVLVGEITSKISIESLIKWQQTVINAGESPSFIIAINKIDLANEYKMTPEEITDYLKKHFGKCSVILVSALTGEGIDSLFYVIAREGIKTLSGSPMDYHSTNIDVAQNKQCKC